MKRIALTVVVFLGLVCLALWPAHAPAHGLFTRHAPV